MQVEGILQLEEFCNYVFYNHNYFEAKGYHRHAQLASNLEKRDKLCSQENRYLPNLFREVKPSNSWR